MVWCVKRELKAFYSLWCVCTSMLEPLCRPLCSSMFFGVIIVRVVWSEVLVVSAVIWGPA